ncbi:uncharacterized transporter slc-17.2 [Nematostella vectensis]|uniref:uncharacterized transporter slc-17.2 n=1 Tax=Nematostella vectensis TaxID=45351 RepID=UPI0013902ABE|nr:uncharacterized transporter slc-17.2 [Nematostella vectensis]
MAGGSGLENGLTRFLNALYTCFRFISRLLICFQFCECNCKKPNNGKKSSKSSSLEKNGAQGSRDRDLDGNNFTFPKRYVLAIMTFLGFMNMYALRVNLNVALGAMVNNHTVNVKGMKFLREAEFHWNSKTQGIVLGSFYYGYAFLQIPGAWLALKLGGTRIFGYAIFMASMLTLLTPIATRCSVYGMITVRAAEGLMLGAVFPCNHAIWSKWAPPLERTTLVTLAISGCHVGTIITMPLSGLLTKYGFDGGWASVFYCFGAAGILWFVAWQLIVHDSPDEHPTISEGERKMINSATAHIKTDVPVPWRAMLTSVPVWAIVVGNLAADWGLYTILICLPMFLVDILHTDIQTMGFLAAAPFLVKSLSGPFGGVTADLLRRRMSTQSVRRLYYSVGALGAGSFIVIAGYATNATAAVSIMCVGVAASGLLHSGYNVNMLDIAPPYACIIMGLCNTLGTTAGFLSPLLVGIVTVNKEAREWRTVFWITFFVYLVGAIVFCTFMSGDLQPWAGGSKLPPEEDRQELQLTEDGLFPRADQEEEKVKMAEKS